MPSTFEFDFIDGPFPSTPAPGTDIMFTSHHRAWWHDSTVSAIRDAHRLMTDHIAEHGPFDIVMGFSQGCSLISSYLLYHARETPDAPLPFKAAVFICGGVPLPALEDLGVAVSQRARDINDATSSLLNHKTAEFNRMAKNLELIQPGKGLWDDTADLLHDPAQLPDERDAFGLDFTAMPADLRIKIPTVHVYGAKDPRWPASLQLAYFCDNRKMYDHGGGHEILRTHETSKTIADLVAGLN